MKRLLLYLAATALCWGVTVPTANYDNNRTGSNSAETVLTPTNVVNLLKVGSFTLDGPVLSQPLYIPAVTISGTAYNVLLVATMNNSLYALDADKIGSPPLWRTNFGATWTVGSGAFFNIFYTQAGIGILSTPVTDGTYIYAVTVNNTPTYTLRKVALATGVQSTSVAVAGSVTGTGAGTVGGSTDDTTGANLNFHASFQLQRGALTLSGGNVYFTFGAAGDEAAVWHGWVFGYSASTLSQIGVFCSTPNANGAGIWEAGGTSADGSGNLYVSTGNGSWDGISSFAQTVFKLSSTLTLLDWFTPADHATTGTLAEDADLSSGRVILIPGTTLMTLGSKDGRVWVIDTTSMGHLQGTGTAPQVFTTVSFTPNAGSGIFGGLFFGSVGFFPVDNRAMYAYTFSGSTFNTTPLATLGTTYPRMVLSGSSNAGTTPIVWSVTPDTGSPVQTARAATLRAFNPSTLAEYWNSGTGNIGTYGKYISPLVANGKVYVVSWDGTVVCFGLPPTPTYVITG